MRSLLRKRNLIILSVIVLLAAIGGAVFRHVRQNKKIEATRSKFVADFNQSFQRNLVGGEFLVETFGHATLNMTWSDKELEPKRQTAVLNYHLEQDDRAYWVIGLNALDISQATSLQFWVRLTSQRHPEVNLELVDYDGGTVFTDRLAFKATTNWQKMELPLSLFEGVNLNRLSRLVFRFRAEQGTYDGRFLIDDVFFWGPPNVFSESLKDNLYGFPETVLVDTHPLLELPPQYLLRQVAADTWKYFENIVDREHFLPLNYIQIAPQVIVGDYTSPTDIGLYLMSVVSAMDLGFIDPQEASDRVQRTLQQVQELPRYRGLWHNYYNTTNLQVTNAYISSVDNAWLAASLVVIRQAFPLTRTLADNLINEMDFAFLYDPEVGQLHVGYDPETEEKSEHHYGLLVSEARIASVMSVGLKLVPEEHWFKIYRTLPESWDWQSQVPQGQNASYRGQTLFQGYYEYPTENEKTFFVPSWGGSLFEFLMPSLVVDEQNSAPRGLGLNNQRAVDIHIQYALKEKRLPVWGLSPSATPPEHAAGGYAEFGVPELGVKGYPDDGIVTSHASVLAINLAPAAVLENLRQLLKRYRIYGPYGFYDAVNARTGSVAHRYLALDQGMILIALNNYLNDGAIQKRFHADGVMRTIEPLLRMESFFPER